ncbi:MAG: phosphotransferase [Deltaproteobacteria bacterium]|nr:phosphotransferase [Deltaproteobacteria bacterium]
MSDLSDFVLRTGEQLAWMAHDRALAGYVARRDGIPGSVDDIDAAWLSEALQASFPGAVVGSVRRVGGHSGTTTRARIELSYSEKSEGGDAGEPPRRLFVKTTPASLGTRLFTGVLQLGLGEVGFYRDIRDSVPTPTPRAYCARVAPGGGRFVILLEDLAERGCRFTTIDDPLSLDEVRAVVRNLARFHAAFWESPRFAGDLAWVKSRRNNPHRGVERMISARANDPAIARHRDLLPEVVCKNAHRISEQRELLEDYWSEGPLTLIHGDSHVGNMYFDGEEAGLLDWQMPQRSQGIRDVGYFLVNSLDTELRRAHQDELIELYLSVLERSGVPRSHLDRQEMWRRYRGHALYVWIASSVTAATPGLQPEAVARRAMQRTGDALEDLASFELLDELSARSGRR